MISLVAVLCLTADPNGQVQLPLDTYQSLVQTANGTPKPALIGYALGKAEISVAIEENAGRITGNVDVALSVEVFENKWVLVPILPGGVSVSSVTADGEALQLSATPQGLAWSTDKAGVHKLSLSYAVDAAHFAAGYQLALPVPRAAAAVLEATFPGTSLDVAVIPSSGAKIEHQDDETKVHATLPATSSVSLSWRPPTKDTHTISRAVYSGQLRDDAVAWSGEYSVEVFSGDSLRLKLLPQSVTLADVKVDNKPASIIVEGDSFAVIVKGRGAHKVLCGFETPVVRADGPPHVELHVPQVPVSRFDLQLPGKKEVVVEPAASVSNKKNGSGTLSTVFVPLTDHVTLTWNEAIPEEVKQELRANASVYHSAHAEEGVLYVRATVEYEITRGETNLVTLDVPNDVTVTKVTAGDNSVSDWRVQRGKLSVFLGRQASSTFTFDVFYERKAEAKTAVPMLRAVGVHRQRGMLALLSGKEATLKPVDDKQLTRVGENQLPPFVRQAIDKTIATTYKYNDDPPQLVVQAAPPEKKEGKFDAQVDTLISLGDVTLRGSATVEVNVKSGSLMELQLTLPRGVNFLNLTAPSLRTHKLAQDGDKQVIDVQFTQDMEGQFRLELSYERIMNDGETNVSVPTIAVRAAEVEQGRIAVEALTAVEVQPASAEQLSSLDVKDLPQMLVLKTTNPILLAYKYVHVDPPYTLGLKITRHKEIDVQSATIDEAHYQTLFTRDGMAITTASLTLRNSRKQFLKIALPPESQVWSAFVDGKPEKPALQTDDTKGPPSVLIKIINSAKGFPVDVVYATPISRVRALGTIGATLPRPDLVVTRSHWDVYLPDGLSYGAADANMDVIAERVSVGREAMAAAAFANDSQLRISVPAAGVRYSFEKLYANQTDDDPRFSVPYASGGGAALAEILTLLGGLLFAGGLWLRIRRDPRVPPRMSGGAATAGAVLLALTVGYLRTSGVLLSCVVAVAGAVLLARAVVAHLRRRRAATQPT